MIVANAVALAMLERRRELGVLKALGYTSEWVLGGMLLENGTAAVGGLFGMVIVAVAVGIFGRVTKTSLGVGAPIAILIIAGVVLLATNTAPAVAWARFACARSRCCATRATNERAHAVGGSQAAPLAQRFASSLPLISAACGYR